MRLDVIRELEWEPALSHYDIGVAVNGGIVTLAGTAPSLWAMLDAEVEVRWQFQRKLAESAVRGTDGVAGISNAITIKTNVSPAKGKDQIEEVFRRRAELEARRITVEVEGNRVTLRGAARSWSEKE